VGVGEALVIGVDVGTYETKAVAVDAGGHVVARARRSHQLTIPRPGWAEHDPESVWWDGLVDVVSQLLASPGVSADRVTGLGTCAIGPCVLPLDEAHQPLRDGILYGIDTRSTEQIEALVAAVGADVLFERTLNPLTTQSAGPKILWIRDEEPDIYGAARLFVTAQTFLVGRLTGEWVIDHATAGYYDPLYDPVGHRWATDLVDIVDEDRLPDLAWASEIAGVLSPAAADSLGLHAGTPVVVGTSDAPAAALAAGCYESANVMVMYGSSVFMIAVMDEARAHRKLWSAPFLFDGTHVLAGGMATAGTLTRWFVDLVAPDVSHHLHGAVFRDLEAAAASTPPGADGLIALPYFSGERTPINDPHARGLFFGLTLTHGRGHLYRALLEATAQGIRSNLDVFAECGVTPEVIRATGGGTQNAVWTQAVSDASGIGQEIVASEGAALGAAFLAALGTGLVSQPADIHTWTVTTSRVEPDRSLQMLYENQAHRTRTLYEATKSMMHDIAEEQGKSS
jgi:xylulokinase